MFNQISHVGDWLSRTEAYISKQWLDGWTPSDIPNLAGKTALVTGANSGIGFETCRKLAENGAKVFMVCRVMSKGIEAANRIRAEVGKSANLEVLECDLRLMENVVAVAREFQRRSQTLDILINMAGVLAPGPYSLTPDGFEQTLAINYYAPALLTIRLLHTLKATHGSRVVFMSSLGEAFGRLDWNNLRGDKYRNSGFIPYGTSKMFMLMFARELSVRVPEVDFLCVHPGVVMSPGEQKSDKHYLSAVWITFNAHIFGQTPYRGAYSTLYAATEPSLTGTRWGYYGPNNANLWPTAKRGAFNWNVKKPILCWKLFEETVRILHGAVGSRHPFAVPLHPRALTPNPAINAVA